MLARGGDIATVARDWLLIDCAHKGEVRLAHARPSATPVISSVRRYETSIPTFTDVLLRYARDSGHQLVDLQPVIAIAGVAGGPSMVVERSRWVISRDGLSALFGQTPVIINEVAAQAWALRASLDGVSLVHGPKMPDLRRSGRYVFLTYSEGVGTAILDVDARGMSSVLDGEGGQLDFVATSDAERELARLVIGHADAAISWEQILMLRQSNAAKTIANSDRLFARLLGRFVSNLIYTSGAWDGAFMMGSLIPPADVLNAEFASALSTKRPYSRLLAKSAAFRVTQADSVLQGCAAMMAAHLG